MTAPAFVQKSNDRANTSTAVIPPDSGNPRIAQTVGRTTLAILERLSRPTAASLALHWFCTPRGPRTIKPRDLAWLNLIKSASYFAGKRIAVYEWGSTTQRPVILLTHGWCGWGTQLKEFVQPLLDAGFAVVSFDQVAHGGSEGHKTTLVEFAEALRAVGASYPRIGGVIGHSMGGGAAAIACGWGLPAEKLVMIASPVDYVRVSRFFAKHMGIAEPTRALMQHYLERKTGHPFESLGIQQIGPRLRQDLLAIYDDDDPHVVATNRETVAAVMPNATILRTQGLGHYRILKDAEVIAKIVTFLGHGEKR